MRPISRLFGYLSVYRLHLATAIVSSVLNKIFDLMPPLLVGWVIDAVRGAPPLWIGRIINTQDPFETAIFLSLLAVAIFFFESLFQWAYQYGFMTLAQKVQHTLRTDTYAHLQTREMAFFEGHRLGDTLAIVNDDVNQIERFLNTGFNEFVHLIVLMTVSGAIMFSISWPLALIGVLPIPLILWGSMTYQKLLGPRYKAVREAVGALNSRLENNISGMMVIQSFGAEIFEAGRVRDASTQYQKQNRHAILISALYTPLIRMAVVLGFAGVLLVGSYWVLQDTGVLTVGELVLFAMLTERLLWPLTRLGTTLDDYERAMASCRRIFGVVDTPTAIRDPETPENFPEQTSISIQNMTFGYLLPPDAQEKVVLTRSRSLTPIINAFSLEISAGETIGIVGKTGCGKSTLVKLLMRFYDPLSGEIRIGNHDIRQLRLSDLRQNIALVSQDIYLFHGSIFENIAYALHASPFDVEDAAKQAALHDFIMSLPHGYATLVGERGIRLSGGQRQRLSIARAILKKAPIMIFDEATSAVDTETERIIHDNLATITAGKTAIVIAHRLSTIRHANRIVVIDNGQIAESGNHNDLITKQGLYAELWRVQGAL